MVHAKLIFHIAEQSLWTAAQTDGFYRPASLAREGFIHCSTRTQLVKVANAFYRGRHDLVLLAIDTSRLRPELRWEAPVHPNPDSAPATSPQERFPHLYGALNIDAVAQTLDFTPDDDGLFSFEN